MAYSMYLAGTVGSKALLSAEMKEMSSNCDVRLREFFLLIDSWMLYRNTATYALLG